MAQQHFVCTVRSNNDFLNWYLNIIGVQLFLFKQTWKIVSNISMKKKQNKKLTRIQTQHLTLKKRIHFPEIFLKFPKIRSCLSE
jgi:hypothetical protein